MAKNHPDIKLVIRPGRQWFYRCSQCGDKSVDFDPCAAPTQESALKSLEESSCHPMALDVKDDWQQSA
jgi:hypothetical protein